MKKTFVYIFILLLLSSCSQSANIIVENHKSDTIKTVVKQKNSDCLWTDELEPDTLTASIRTKENFISKDLTVSRESLMIFNNLSVPVYPSLENFAVLDVSALTSRQLNTITRFCDALSNNKDSDALSCFSQNYKFNYIFFKQKLKDSYNKKIDSKYNFNDTTNKSKTLFTSYNIGEPFFSENIVQLPVRFCCNQKYVDVTLIMSLENDNSIFQISIARWGN